MQGVLLFVAVCDDSGSVTGGMEDMCSRMIWEWTLSFGSDWGVVSLVIARLYKTFVRGESVKSGSQARGTVVMETCLSRGG